MPNLFENHQSKSKLSEIEHLAIDIELFHDSEPMILHMTV